ncbi:DUF5068 domain-containing protein [Lysinibacillus xylanilyticus]|uniref:DUF5068 domain-containing protein n=1 Tax=Lysinibacillus xylanilyticus TaxID=582475 RepID=UPI002B24D72E|nr:DUF5068 domain-containing protein [Lysinibacillus xylanilyticus]MEB2299169.1 DUF5068 domain-containing protein [Lysinibacillus xylanilyticus]
MKKTLFLMSSLILSTSIILSGCGKDGDETKKDDEPKKTQVEKGQDKEKDKVQKEEPKKDQESTKGSADFASLISYMEKETQGKTKVLFENNESQVHKMENVSISLDAYSVVELKDFHTDFNIPFGEENNGGVILAKYTVKNDMDKDVYYMPSLDVTFTGASKYYTNDKYLIPEEDQLPTKLSFKTDYLIKAGDEVTGYIAYPFGETDLAKINELGTVSVMIPVPLAEKEKYDATIGTEGRFNLALNTDGSKKVSSNSTFYQDKVTMDNMGEKKILKEKSDINESKKIGDVNAVLEGYQFTKFTPNEVEAPRFSNFTNGVSLLTVKFKLENKATSEIGLSSMSSKLTVNDGMQYLLSEGMLLNYKPNDVIKAGENGELLQVFVLDQEQYEKIWKDKAFDIELGPIRNKGAEDTSKGKKETFTLPK